MLSNIVLGILRASTAVRRKRMIKRGRAVQERLVFGKVHKHLSEVSTYKTARHPTI